jgi:hypothetical protein
VDNLRWEFESLGEMCWAYDFMKNVEKRSDKDPDIMRVEKALRESLEELNKDCTFHRNYLKKTVLSYIHQIGDLKWIKFIYNAKCILNQ